MPPAPTRAARALRGSRARWGWPRQARRPCRPDQGPPCQRSGSSRGQRPGRPPSLRPTGCRRPPRRCRRCSHGSRRGGPHPPSRTSPSTWPRRSGSPRAQTWRRTPGPPHSSLHAGRPRLRCPRRARSNGATTPSPPRAASPAPAPAPPGSGRRKCSQRGDWGSSARPPPDPPGATDSPPSARTPWSSRTPARGSRRGSRPPSGRWGSGKPGGSGSPRARPGSSWPAQAPGQSG
mmetsp:Transcript_90990/g.271603  ORF Transcript_90990/g.271603 Transcript_90990/m.271603 type:complete len:234 (+) Transcript_90990:858-1559(+)